MKTLILTAGALALTAGVAQAEPNYAQGPAIGYDQVAPMAAYGASPGGYVEPVGSPSAYTNYPAVGPSPASGFRDQNSYQAMSWSTNRGAGTSRSSSANNG